MDGLSEGLAMFEMKCERLKKLWEAILKQLLDDQTRPFVYDLSILFQQAVINYLLRRGVFKDVFQVRLGGLGANQIQPLQSEETAVRLIAKISDSLEEFVEEDAADDRSLLQHPLGLPFQVVQSRRNDALDGRGQVGLTQRTGTFPVAVLPDQRPHLDEGVDEFFQVKGIPLCLVLNEA
jgi:hypothetical protein